MEGMSYERAARLRRLSRRVDQAQQAARCAETLARSLGVEGGTMPALFYAQVLRAARQTMEVPPDIGALFAEARRVTGSGIEGGCEGG